MEMYHKQTNPECLIQQLLAATCCEQPQGMQYSKRVSSVRPWVGIRSSAVAASPGPGACIGLHHSCYFHFQAF